MSEPESFDVHAARRFRRSETSRNSGLSADQVSAGIRRGEAGADLARGQARLSDPRRHPDHAARRSAAVGLTIRTWRFSIVTPGLDPGVHADVPRALD